MIKSILILLCMSGISCGKNVTVTVVDEEGKPVEGVEIIAWSIGSNKSEDQKFEGTTNNDGIASIEAKNDTRRLRIYVKKENYYTNTYKHSYGTAIYVKNESVISVKSILKKKIKPIPLFVREQSVKAPEEGKKVGFDFEVGEFVTPHGKGKIADVFFEQVFIKHNIRDYDYKLIISFPHEKDGIQSFLTTQDDFASDLKSPRIAPAENYEPTFQRVRSRRGMGSKIQTNKVQWRNHWMRVRTRIDKKGDIVSANYVKIYGDFPEMIYYFNPTPNARNLEFDPSGNLSKNLENKHRKFAP